MPLILIANEKPPQPRLERPLSTAADLNAYTLDTLDNED